MAYGNYVHVSLNAFKLSCEHDSALYSGCGIAKAVAAVAAAAVAAVAVAAVTVAAAVKAALAEATVRISVCM